jgi:hypothetical protein
LSDDRAHGDDHVNWGHLIAHGIAFCAASVIAAIVFYPYYPKFRYQTDSASEAFGAFLTLCVIFGGFGPLVTLLFFAGRRLTKNRGTAAQVSRE